MSTRDKQGVLLIGGAALLIGQGLIAIRYAGSPDEALSQTWLLGAGVLITLIGYSML